MNTAGTLYIVGTPIGNLEDMSPRGIRILKEVSFIAAEDTRHTKKLLTHFDIHTPMESYHKFSEKQKFPKLLESLTAGKDIALVSSAGTPGISDPGEILIKEAVKNNIKIIPIPGPTALILALVASGLSTTRFAFEGFLPPKKGQRAKRLYSLKAEERTMIFYENGQRLDSTLRDMQNILGDRKISIARELTKKFEEITRNNISNILANLSKNTLKGEFVIALEGTKKQKPTPKKSLKEEIKSLQKQLGITSKEAIKLVAAKFDIPKRKVYSKWLDGKN